MIKNQKSILKLLSFIIYTNSLNYSLIDNQIKKINLKDLTERFIKLRETQAEIFQRPDLTLLRNMGDCDDFVTLASYICEKNNINYLIGFKIKNNAAYHVYIKINRQILDPWNTAEDGNEIYFDLNLLKRLQV